MKFVTTALFCSAGALLASSVTLAAASRLEKVPLQRPINATSHWMRGVEVIDRDDLDLKHTALGGATNTVSAAIWGTLFAAYLKARPPRSTATLFRDAAAAGGIIGAIDYGLMPKRLTPGWELALTGRSVVLTLIAMSGGLAGGALLAQMTTAEGREEGADHE